MGFALAAGLVAALNPCGFALLPGYLTLVVLGDADDSSRGRPAAVVRALVATVVMAAGFLVVFGTFGLVVAPLAFSVQQYLPVVTVVIGGGLVVLGAWMLSGRELSVILPKLSRGAPTVKLGSMFGYGVAYAIASLSCTIGPFLAVTSATFRSGSILGGAAAYLAYGAGMAVTVGVAATAVALIGSNVTSGVRRLLPHINRLGGALLVVTGAYVAYYGVYELRLYFGDGDAGDAIIEAAGGIAQALAQWVDGVGIGRLGAVLVALVTLTAILGIRRARRGRLVRLRGPRTP